MISPFSAPYFTVRPAKFKSLFWSPKYLFKKNSTRFKEKYTNEENEQNSEADIPNFRVGFFEFLSRTSKKTLDKTSFFPHTSPLCHKSERKKLGPYLTVRPSNSISKRYVWWEISALESLWNASKPWFPRLKPIHTRWTSRISVPQVD